MSSKLFDLGNPNVGILSVNHSSFLFPGHCAWNLNEQDVEFHYSLD